MGDRVEPMTAEEITETARMIVTDKYLVPDLSDSSWRSSLALIASSLRDVPNIGALLVPLEPHLSGRWINGVAPGLTLQVKIVPEESMEALKAEVERMAAALYPREDSE